MASNNPFINPADEKRLVAIADKFGLKISRAHPEQPFQLYDSIFTLLGVCEKIEEQLSLLMSIAVEKGEVKHYTKEQLDPETGLPYTP